MESDSNITKTPVKTHLQEAESEFKISQDKMASEKIMSFGGQANGGRGGGVSITFSEAGRPERGRGEGGVASSPGSASSAGENIHSQLAAVKLKLEQKRKKIEDDKRRMEMLMSRQREKVGQEAFLRAVAKGMSKESCEGEQETRKPFILNKPSSSSKVSTPEVESKTLDLYQLQRGLQKMTTTQQASPHHEPFYISQQPQQQKQQPQQQMPQSSAPQPQQQQQPHPVSAGVHPYFMYPGHPPPPPWYGMMPYPPHPPPHPYYPGYPPPHPQMMPPQQQEQHQQLQSPTTSITEKPAPLTDKPSLSSSFLEMKRRQYQTEPGCQSPVSSHPSVSFRASLSPAPASSSPGSGGPSGHSTPVKQSLSSSFLRSKQKQQQKNGNGFSDSSSFSSHNNSQTPELKSSRSPEPSQMSDLNDTSDYNPDLDSTDNAMVDNSPPLVLTQSTIETLNSMTTEEIHKENEKELSKGFVISFGPGSAVKPKPVLKPRQSSITKMDKELSSLQSSGTASPVTRRSSSLGSSKETSQLSLTSPGPRDCDNQVTPSPALCLVCQVRQIDASVPGGKTCSLCSEMLIKTNGDQGLESSEVCDGTECSFDEGSLDSWCPICWRKAAEVAGLVRKVSGGEEDSQRQRDWVVMMSEKRRQQAEESRVKREEEAVRRREEEANKKEELLRKKEDDKKRREAIFEAYKLKKENDKLKEEGMNFFSSKPPPKLRPKSAGGNRMRPRPNTIHVDNRDNDVTGSQNNITMYRSLTRGESAFRRGSNVSLHDGGSAWSGSGSGDMRSLSMFSRSKSSSASNLGPTSLQLGMRGRGSRHDDDNCSEVSSTTSGYTSGRGSARLYREPVSKTNRPIILNAVEYVVLPGEVNKETRRRVMEEIEKCDCPHFLILFRDSKLQFRALYAYYPDTEEVFKIHGVGPRQVTDKMMDIYYKYNSGGKKFTQIHTKHLTATIDAFTIHNSLWLGKKTKLPDKDTLALVV